MSSQVKNDETKPLQAKHLKQISVLSTNKSSNSSLQLSSAFELSSVPKKSVCSKLFSWNEEKPRKTSEYVDKKYEEPFNKVAPELRMIGGLGQIKCVAKHKQQPLINRPTQVQKICHTTTKILPDFSLTEQLRPAACLKKKRLTFAEAAETVKLAENLPSSSSSTQTVEERDENEDNFSHENPFNLDLSALSVYQKQRNDAEETEIRRNYQMIRRTMETKALKTEGVERMKQEERDEKFKLPKFLNVNEDVASALGFEQAKKSDDDERRCGYFFTSDKPENREILRLHLQHKEDKALERIRKQALANKVRAKEMEKLEEEERENLGFRLADASECDESEQKLQAELEPFDYLVNESKANRKWRSILGKGSSNVMENGISCGEKRGNRVILRSFHDRISKEPRGETNYHQLKNVGTGKSTFRSHKEWLDAIANDPEILREPPRGKLVSTVKLEQEPNDDKMFLFDDLEEEKTNVAIVSPIRQHIEQIDAKLKARLVQEPRKKSKSHTNNNNQKRYQRMKFMGIPVLQSSQLQTKDCQEIVEKISQSSILYRESLSSVAIDKRKNLLPRDVKLIPKIPEFDCTTKKKRERSRIDEFVPFSKAQPRGTNAKNLRVDKSLPWIQDELNATKVKLERDCEKGETFTAVKGETRAHEHPKEKLEESLSAFKMTYKEKIVEKLKSYQPDNEETEEFDIADEVRDEMQSSDETSSSLSSVGTYFTNDSGSCLVELDRKTPKTELNLDAKYQNRSLVKTKKFDDELPPFFIPTVAQFDLVRQLKKPKDKFHTFRTRSDANIRERTRIESLSYEEELIGSEKFKATSKLATDFDEFYRDELYHERSRSNYRFKPSLEIRKIRRLFLQKMDVFWMKEFMTLEHVDLLEQEKVIKEATEMTMEQVHLLDFLTDDVFNRAMIVQDKLQVIQNENKIVAKELWKVQDKLEPVQARIVNMSFDFVELRFLQKFQFLLKPVAWRLKFDHLHRTANNEIEYIPDSINNRGTTNLWVRKGATAYTVRDFILNEYVHEPKPICVFSTSEKLLTTISNLESRSYQLLVQFHSASLGMVRAKLLCDKVEAKNDKSIKKMTQIVKNFEKKKDFMVARAKEMESIVQRITGKPLKDSLSSKRLRTLRGNCDVIFQDVVLKATESPVNDEFTSIDKIAGVEKIVFELLRQIDDIPKSVTAETEEEVREERESELLIASRAQKIEDNLQMRINQLHRCLEKPKPKLKREGKLPVSVLPKKPAKVKLKKRSLGSDEKAQLKAFVGNHAVEGQTKLDEEEAKTMLARIKNANIPFYVDHLLEKVFKLPSKPKDYVEKLILDETEHLKHKEFLPEVRRQVNVWFKHAEDEKRRNIEKTGYLYK